MAGNLGSLREFREACWDFREVFWNLGRPFASLGKSEAWGWEFREVRARAGLGKRRGPKAREVKIMASSSYQLCIIWYNFDAILTSMWHQFGIMLASF